MLIVHTVVFMYKLYNVYINYLQKKKLVSGCSVLCGSICLMITSVKSLPRMVPLTNSEVIFMFDDLYHFVFSAWLVMVVNNYCTKVVHS